MIDSIEQINYKNKRQIKRQKNSMAKNAINMKQNIFFFDPSLQLFIAVKNASNPNMKKMK